MRIALVITELYPGGAEKCFVNLACYLQRQGHEVRVWQLWPDPPPEKSQLTQQLDDHGILWSSGQAVKAWQFLRATSWLKRELKQFAPDIVQAFLFHANLASALATRKIPCRFFGGARVTQPEGWRQRVQRWSAKRMEKLICVSQSVANHVAQIEGIQAEKLSVIANGIELVDLESPIKLTWAELGIPNDTRVLLFVGRLTEQKGIIEFISTSATRLLQRLPEHHLVIMGDGERATELRELLRLSPFAKRLHHVGWQTAAHQWMRLAELIFLPAKYEGMPNVILEAMAVGKPIASFNVEGVTELLGSDPFARMQMAQARDYEGLESVIVVLAESSDLRSACGAYNRHRATENFQIQQQLAKYEQLYLAAIEK